jgi:hypothetical protein
LDVFLPCIYDYVNTFTGKSITTEQWKEHLFGYYEKNDKSKVELLKTVDFDVGICHNFWYDMQLTSFRLGYMARA